jgi:hypothetical protein
MPQPWFWRTTEAGPVPEKERNEEGPKTFALKMAQSQARNWPRLAEM